ncbi:hypothetical protein [Tenacibaculum sp. SG-28]|uniref:hypothetical protein n=1 Tax=Tenacibaculum sp. SG-28 TaxID=754426 RepID=UPI001E380C3B|nr:hypothetical protein [Tenacibaculum sp. SG-28]
MMRSTYWIVFVLLWNSLGFVAQNDSIPQTDFLSYEEYIGYVKKYHPTIKQANLKLNIGEAALLRARGGFDPKIDVDFDRKSLQIQNILTN